MTDPGHCRWCGRTQPCRHCDDTPTVPPEIATFRARMADPRMHWVRDLLARVEAVHDGRPQMRCDSGEVIDVEWRTVADMIVRELDTPRTWRARNDHQR